MYVILLIDLYLLTLIKTAVLSGPSIQCTLSNRMSSIHVDARNKLHGQGNEYDVKCISVFLSEITGFVWSYIESIDRGINSFSSLCIRTVHSLLT